VAFAAERNDIATATLAAPPGRSFGFVHVHHGTGASGESARTSPEPVTVQHHVADDEDVGVAESGNLSMGSPEIAKNSNIGAPHSLKKWPGSRAKCLVFHYPIFNETPRMPSLMLRLLAANRVIIEAQRTHAVRLIKIAAVEHNRRFFTQISLRRNGVRGRSSIR